MTGGKYIHTTEIVNDTPSSWNAIIVGSVNQYVHDDNSNSQVTAGNINLSSGQSAIIKSQDKCVWIVKNTAFVRLNGQVQQVVGVHNVGSKDKCLINSQFVLAPAQSLDAEKLRSLGDEGLFGALELRFIEGSEE